MTGIITGSSELILWCCSVKLHCHLHLSPTVELQVETFHYLPVADNGVSRTVLLIESLQLPLNVECGTVNALFVVL